MRELITDMTRANKLFEKLFRLEDVEIEIMPLSKADKRRINKQYALFVLYILIGLACICFTIITVFK